MKSLEDAFFMATGGLCKWRDVSRPTRERIWGVGGYRAAPPSISSSISRSVAQPYRAPMSPECMLADCCPWMDGLRA